MSGILGPTGAPHPSAEAPSNAIQMNFKMSQDGRTVCVEFGRPLDRMEMPAFEMIKFGQALATLGIQGCDHQLMLKRAENSEAGPPQDTHNLKLANGD